MGDIRINIQNMSRKILKDEATWGMMEYNIDMDIG